MNLSWITNTNRLYYVLVGLIVLVAFISFIFILRNLGTNIVGNPTGPLEFWGVFDDTGDFRQVITEFERQFGRKIAYRKFQFEDYEKTLINSLAAGTGPDIFMIHHAWLPKHGDKIAPMPERMIDTKEPLMTISDFRNQFVDVAYDDLVVNEKIFAMPMYVDTLALYYNRDMLNSAGVSSAPGTWDDFNSAIEKITRLDSRGNIIRSGAAIGTVENINRPTDILAALMIQSGVQMTNPNKTQATFSRTVGNFPAGETALQYYTDFANPLKRVYTWNNALNYSIDSFIEGQTAMMFNYYHQNELLRSRAPRLNFAVAEFPQITNGEVRNYANYWAAAVSNSTGDIESSWKFVNFLASRDGASLYLSNTLRPSARRDLIELQRNEVDLGVFAVQALSAKSWYQADNEAIETIFSEMIEDVNFGRASTNEALRSAESKVNVLMKRR